MPHYTASIEIPRPIAEIFRFMSTSKNLVQLAPADLNLELLAAPEMLTLGAKLTWKGRRWGISQQIIQEITLFENEKGITVEQKQGPFKKWVHVHQFVATDAGTLMHDRVEFEPPGGLLGRLIGAASIEKDLEKLFAFRQKKLRELFV